MNIFSFKLFFCCLLLTILCGGWKSFQKKEVCKTENNGQEKRDTAFPYFIGKHPLPKRYAVYFEFYGSSANLYSLNFERLLFLHTYKSGRMNRFSLRIGVNCNQEKYALPLMFHFSTGRVKCFETGAGWVPWLSEKKRVDGVAAFAGFRLQPTTVGLMARFGLTPTYLIQEKRHWRMLYGISFGFVF